MPAPLVTVLITAYNAEPWLAEALDSATGQTWPNVEVVVVDDGSTDRTLEIARRYESASVRVIHQENAGACAARNRAFSEAQGDFIQYLDADDLLAPDKIERQLRRLEREPPRTVATGPWSRFYNDDLATAAQTSAPDWRDYEPASDWLIQSWEGRGTFFPAVWLIPHDVAEQAGPWNESILLNQDGEYVARVLVTARKIVFVEEAWSYYRSSGPNSVSRRRNDEALRSLFDAYRSCERTLLAHRGDTPEARRAVAGLWQHYMFMTFPRLPDLVHRAESRVEELGGMYRKPGVSRPLRPIRDLIGWRSALRLQRLYQRIRYGSR